nr:MAG TPA: hypothetical protein [Caudoviricetes sp.]
MIYFLTFLAVYCLNSVPVMYSASFLAIFLLLCSSKLILVPPFLS